jgi:hypothetical protein
LYATLLTNTRFHDMLLACDRDLADLCRAEGCACGGRLDSARYRRKPRGRPQSLRSRLGPEYNQRFSFCCAVDGCRTRETPASLRFLGRKIYLAAIVVLISMMLNGVTASRMEGLGEAVRVDRRTVERWRTWWREAFTSTPYWRIASAAFMPPVDHDRLPAALIERFTGGDQEQLLGLLRFFGPITGGDNAADRAHAR